MTAPRPAAPPTLTEVIHLPDSALAPTEPMPLAPDSMPIEALAAEPAPLPAEPRPMRLAEQDAEWRSRLVDDLRPTLQGWLDAEVQKALLESMPALSERLSAALRRRLDDELPALLERALEEARRTPNARG